jgi:hypothetical protein
MTDSRRPSDLADKMMMRLPPGMRERIADAAKVAGRSMNAEVVARLEKSFETDLSVMAMAEMVEQHEDQISTMWRDIEDLKGSVSSLYRR